MMQEAVEILLYVLQSDQLLVCCKITIPVRTPDGKGIFLIKPRTYSDGVQEQL